MLADNKLVLTMEEKDKHFNQWFKEKVDQLHKDGKCPMGDQLLSLSHHPTTYGTSFTGYTTNGYRFHSQSREKKLQTQNSGVFVHGNIGARTENIDYYGVLTDVIRLEYMGAIMLCYFVVISGMSTMWVEG